MAVQTLQSSCWLYPFVVCVCVWLQKSKPWWGLGTADANSLQSVEEKVAERYQSSTWKIPKSQSTTGSGPPLALPWKNSAASPHESKIFVKINLVTWLVAGKLPAWGIGSQNAAFHVQHLTWLEMESSGWKSKHRFNPNPIGSARRNL